MIAPIKKSKVPTSSPGILHARRLVASALLKQRPRSAERPPSVAAWRAWLFTAWVVVVAAVYFASMAGLL